MTTPVHYQVTDGVAVLTIDNGPVNSISAAVRAGIAAGIERAVADPGVSAVVLTGARDVFCGGAEVREFNTPLQRQSPTLPELNQLQDKCPKPMVAAIAGFAFGGGLELAMACHWRIGLRGATLGLPEVKLGLMPGSGGTQRLPRLVPMEVAVEMMTTGKPMDADAAWTHGLVSELVDDDLFGRAIALAKSMVEAPNGLRKVSALPVRSAPGTTELLEVTKRKFSGPRGSRGALDVVACCEAAMRLPFDQGLAFERERFLQLLAGPEFKALSHAFFAERESRKVPGLTTAGRPLNESAVIGAGTMGSGIAMCLANAGLPVTLIDTDAGSLERGMGAVRKYYDAEFTKGRLTQAELEARLALVKPTTDIAAVATADLIIEAAFERMDVKQDIFRKLDALAKPGTLLATNTSTLDVDRIAEVTSRPQDVIGLHFFSPAQVMRLLEVVRCKRTADDVLSTSMQLGRRLGKVAVVSGVCDGFIGNRMLQKYLQQALFLLDEGCTPQQVDEAMEAWGMAMGPFAVGDLAGLDIGWSVRKRRREEGSTMVYSAIADKICEAGRLGQKTGKGWYRYEAGSRKRLHDPEVDRLLAEHRAAIGVPQRAISSAEIVERLTFALANEGAAILEAGIALRASDIDIVWITGYGFPASKGGPQFNADAVGLPRVVERMEGFGRGYQGGQWSISPYLRRLAAQP
ncbi:3-hydroxyacyl-CoA dehydrogenase NAD-binding domain-containing protein [Caenimonas soli]|uniref:3-hydroxyacyl-CoA dehydrogenase NAD-binding domain-containing protein n=1 Tax=Caenimonas soli TaxID=2735555 RepID=UPI001557A729|nr:3-hydroxyacyl-CoA dehydrogenase NAD-binding domain-containing protein [Caenimonas soli]NPC56932.1 3-hydroxyacyl-CoA dehydrogenase [Caenimonas soli]